MIHNLSTVHQILLLEQSLCGIWHCPAWSSCSFSLLLLTWRTVCVNRLLEFISSKVVNSLPCAVTAHQTPTSSHAKELHEVHGDFWSTKYLSLLHHSYFISILPLRGGGETLQFLHNFKQLFLFLDILGTRKTSCILLDRCNDNVVWLGLWCSSRGNHVSSMHTQIKTSPEAMSTKACTHIVRAACIHMVVPYKVLSCFTIV